MVIELISENQKEGSGPNIRNHSFYMGMFLFIMKEKLVL